jgi:hypothetical protein
MVTSRDSSEQPNLMTTPDGAEFTEEVTEFVEAETLAESYESPVQFGFAFSSLLFHLFFLMIDFLKENMKQNIAHC